jgi:hypothetical protein
MISLSAEKLPIINLLTANNSLCMALVGSPVSFPDNLGKNNTAATTNRTGLITSEKDGFM